MVFTPTNISYLSGLNNNIQNELNKRALIIDLDKKYDISNFNLFNTEINNKLNLKQDIITNLSNLVCNNFGCKNLNNTNMITNILECNDEFMLILCHILTILIE